jgi:hypothetical protein
LRTRRLDLQLAGNERLERLVAFGLMVLDGRPAIWSPLAADATWPEFAGGCFRPVILLVRRSGPLRGKKYMPDTFAQNLRIEPPGHNV